MPSTLASAYGWILPAIAALDRGIVIVAGDKVFTAMQRLDERCYALRPVDEWRSRPGTNHRIPAINHLAIHLDN